MMWVPGRHHCWISGTSVCAVLSGTTSIMHRPLSRSMAAKTHRPFTRRSLWNFRRKKYDSSISTTMGWPLLSKPPSCRGFRRTSSAQMSRIKFPQSTAVLGYSVSCQVTWWSGISVAQENKNHTSFPRGTLLLKMTLLAHCASGDTDDTSTAIRPGYHVVRPNCMELRNEGSRSCSSAILVQQAIPVVDARRSQASDATRTGRVSVAQQPLEWELRWEAEFVLVLLGDRPLQ